MQIIIICIRLPQTQELLKYYEYFDQAAELISIDPVKEETQTVPQRTIQDHLGGGVILMVVMVLDIFF